MKSEWRVTSNSIGGETMYAAYRLKDANGTDHSGNREYIERSGNQEYRGGYVADRGPVQALVDELNKEATHAD